MKFAFVMTSCLAIRSAAAQPVSVAGAAQAASVSEASQPAATAGAAQSVLPGVLSTTTGATFDGRLDYSSPRSAALLALNLHGQYIGTSGFGGYVALPFAYVSGLEGGPNPVLGNPELGGLYAIRRGRLDAYTRGGVSLNRGSDLESAVFPPLANTLPRPADAITTGFDASFLRVGGGARFTNGLVVIGGAGGVDVELGSGDAVHDTIKVLHLTGSVGIEQPTFGAAVGVTMLQSLEPVDGDGNFMRLQGTADVALGGKTRLYGAAGLNLENLEAAGPALSFGLGVRARF